MEGRFGLDLAAVRVHTDAAAASAARSIGARAFTRGNNIVFAAGEYAPGRVRGDRLIAHELTHVLQQRNTPAVPPVRVSRPDEPAERQAEAVAEGARPDRSIRPTAGSLAAQLVTPLGPGGGYGGLMERDRQRVAAARAAPPPAPYRVCSRDLQGILGYVGNHAYIDAPPYRYAIISPLCPANWYDNPVTGTTAQKWDNSPDPCGKAPTCLDCSPAPGVTDVGRCLRDAFRSYQSLSLYKGLGPNSNTFAGTLARTCCAGMVPKPPALGNCPGWDDPPAPARAGGTPCPPGPTC